MAAEPEEVVVAADLAHPEAGGELRAHPLLVRGAGGAAGRAGGLGLGEAGGVEFAVGGQREPVQHGVGGGHEVVGEGGGEQVADLGRVGAAGAGDQVGGEAARPAGRAGRRHGGVGDPGQGAQRRLHLAGLHPVAPDLELVVGAAEELQGAVGPPPGEVPGAVHAGAGRAVRVGQEAAGGQAGPSRVAPGDARARHVQLAGGAERHRVQRAVEDVGAGSGDGAADGRGGAGDAGGHRVHRGLGRPVVVEDDQVVVGGELGPQGVVDGLAAEREDARPVAGAVEQPGREELSQVAGGGLDRVDPLPGEEGGECLGVAAGGVVGEVQLVTGQHPQHGVPGGVEGGGGGQRHPQRSPERGRGQRVGLAPVVLQQVGERAVLDHHALGAAGGAGGVDDVRRVVGLGRGRLRPAAVRHHGGRVDQLQPLVRHRRPGARHQRHRRRVLEHVRQPVHGVRRVHRQVGRAAAQHREQRRDQVGRAVESDRDPLPGPRPARHQLGGQRPHPRVQFREGQRFLTAHHGGRPRGARGLRGELLGQRRQRPARGHRPRPEPDQPGVLRRRDQRQGAHRPLRVLGERLQQAAERLVVAGESGLVVPVGVGQQVDPDPAVAVRGVCRHRQFLDRADGEVVQGGGQRAEGEGVVEGEHVDGRPRLRLAHPEPPFPAQLLCRETLVPQHPSRLGRRPPGHLGHAVGGRHLQPHRQHVGEHRRGAPRGRGPPPGHRQPQHDLRQPALPVQADPERRHQEGGPGHPGALGGRPQPGRLTGVEVFPSRPHPARGSPRGSGHESGRGGGAVQVARPELPVRRVLSTCPVRLLVRQYGAERRGPYRYRLTGRGDQQGVDLGDPGQRQHRPVPVQGQVVHLLVEEVVAVGQPVERHPHQRAARRVRRARQFGLHPPHRLRARVGVAGEVDHRHLDPCLRRDPLPRHAVPLPEGQPQRLGLLLDVPYRPAQRPYVQLPAHLDVLGDVVGGAVRIEALGEPQTSLRGRQRVRGERAVGRDRGHAGSPSQSGQGGVGGALGKIAARAVNKRFGVLSGRVWPCDARHGRTTVFLLLPGESPFLCSTSRARVPRAPNPSRIRTEPPERHPAATRHPPQLPCRATRLEPLRPPPPTSSAASASPTRGRDGTALSGNAHTVVPGAAQPVRKTFTEGVDLRGAGDPHAVRGPVGGQRPSAAGSSALWLRTSAV
ncbi:hypothetical protein EES47_08570 [Streptomyces sp. ADI98-12]|nr:hypothetical protein EES47_08570 [Streptomyces sp. ADI98-12]